MSDSVRFGEQGHVVRAIDEPDRQNQVALEEALRPNHDTDQLAVVQQHVLHPAQPATGRAEHHVFAALDLDLTL